MKPGYKVKSILEAQGRAWNVEEVQAWLALWVDTTIQRQLLGVVRSTAIFNKITHEMARKGYQCSAKQYRGKVERADEEVQESSRWPLSQWSWSRLRGRMCRRHIFVSSRWFRALVTPSTLLDTS